MPLIDMPLDQLKQCQGVNPRPADFDQYWDESIAEMKAIDPQVELVAADFQVPFADCFDMYFTGVKGARVHAKLAKPKNPTGAAVVQFHGYSGRSPDWDGLLGYPAAGMTTAYLDCRGQAGESEDVGGVKGNTHQGHIIRGLDGGPKDLLFRDIFLDTAQLAGLVMDMEDVDENRVGACGGSQGGGLTLACAALEPRIKIACPIFPFLCDYNRVWNMDLDQGAYSELRTYFRHFDPQHKREEEIFTRLGYIDNQHLAPRIKAKVLMFTGLMDTICPPSTQFAAYNNITSEKRVEIYPDFGHEGLPGSGEMTFQEMLKL